MTKPDIAMNYTFACIYLLQSPKFWPEFARSPRGFTRSPRSLPGVSGVLPGVPGISAIT